ncbi:MAG: exodeoxyribonuclease V subunit gamma [Deltaproteobacteria bacterium]|nr:exodeoxyribonuclease V subunit gamma [Deltaproteobacteria bacterium]
MAQARVPRFDPGLTVIASNRLDILADRLAERLKIPLSDPLKPEIVVVQSRGMQRYLSMHLARKQGICANMTFPFPVGLTHDLFRKIVPEVQVDYVYAQDIMAWRILGCLERLVDQDRFEAVRGYLQGASIFKRFQLAEELALLLDQYLIFRPDLILKWEAGKDDDDSTGWQAPLWRAVSEFDRDVHRAALKVGFHARLDDGGSERLLPERISVFGVPVLPPYYIEIFGHASQFIPVDVYMLSPCREYWGDIRSTKEKAKLWKLEAATEPDGLTGVGESGGNGLLASLGRLGRDFLANLYNTEFVSSQEDLFEGSTDNTLLARIQNDFLDLKEPGHGRPEPIDPDDSSIQIHSCHSPRREVEVLLDVLVDALERNSTLQPDDILVMAPDIQAYASHISAVFDQANPDLRIPFGLADGNLAGERRYVRAFLAVLELARNRAEAPAVLDLMAMDPVMAKFGLSGRELDLIRHWVRRCGIRSAVDSSHRHKQGLPEYPEYTWRSGLERLLLGYAMRQEKILDFSENLWALDGMEGECGPALDGLIAFVKILFPLLDTLSDSRSVEDWGTLLHELLDDLLAENDEEDTVSAAMAREAVEIMVHSARRAGSEARNLDLPTIIHILKNHLRDMEGTGGFMTGGVTFCSFLPMRSIPFRMICLLGMNEMDFPRRDRRPDFDLMVRHPRAGDRSLRTDDRYLFLEALISARQRLHISYIGQSIADNAVLPPSTVVSELLDYIDANSEYLDAPGEKPRSRLVVRHRLQPFHRAYFDSSGPLFSFCPDNLMAAKALGRMEPVKSAFESPLPPVERSEIDLEDLKFFLKNPIRALCRTRLGILMPSDEARLDDQEPFDGVDALTRFNLRRAILEDLVHGQGNLHEVYVRARAENILPPEVLGSRFFEHLVGETRCLADRVRDDLMGRKATSSVHDSLILGGMTLHIHLSGVGPEGLYRYVPSETAGKGKRRLDLWLDHLALCAHVPEDIKPRPYSSLRSDDELIVFEPLAQGRSKRVLAGLLQMWRTGMARPLPFFPDVSNNYARNELEVGPEKALAKAEEQWHPQRNGTGFERESIRYLSEFAFGSKSPLQYKEFSHWARRVFRPMFMLGEKR